MNTKLLKSAQLSILLLFSAACSDDSSKYEYVNKRGCRISFTDIHDKKGEDIFILSQWVLNDLEGNIDIRYEGDFNKDSVEVAVDKYLNTGEIPKHIDLY